MSASELLANLVNARILDEMTLEKLRKEIDSPNKNVKPKAIVRYLLQKGLITEEQGSDLLAGKPLVPALVQDDQFELPAAAKKDYDTDDLTNLVGDLSAAPMEKKAPVAKAAELVDDADMGEIEKPKAPPRSAGRETRQLDLDAVENEPIAKRSRPSHKEPAPTAEVFDEGFEDSGFTSGSSMKAGRTGGQTFAGKLDSSDQWNTRWLWTGFGGLAALIIGAFVLWLGVMRVDADKLYDQAETSFRELAYGKAAELFQDFVKKFPNHDKAPLAEVRGVNALIRLPYSQNSFETAFNVAKIHLPPVAENEAMEELRPDLGVMLPVIVKWYSQAPLQANLAVNDVATKLEAALAAKKELLDPPTYLTTTMKNSQRISQLIGSINNDILTAQGIIKKEEEYVTSKSSIERLTGEGKTDDAFAEFTRLVRIHPDLGARAELRELMAKVSTREIELVKPSNVELVVAKTVPPSPVSKQILTGSTVGATMEAMVSEVLPVLAEGSVYGVDSGNGKLLWRHFVGLQTTIQPQWSDGERKSLVVCDEEKNAITSVDAMTGNVIWSTTIGQTFLSPKIAVDAAYVVTRTGIIIKLNLATGETIAAAQLPKGVSVPCEVADQAPELYVVGDDSNLYILSSDDMKCTSAFYIGHFPGSVRIAPLVWSGHVLVAVSGNDYCDLWVIRKNDEGIWSRIQLVRVAKSGPVSIEPSRLGRLMVFTSDRGNISVLDINPADPENPIRTAVEDNFEVGRGIKNWSLAGGSSLWIAGNGVRRYKIQRATEQLEQVENGNPADVFLGPLREKDDVLFHLRRRNGSGLVGFSAVDALNLKEKWRTDFGGPTAGKPFPMGQDLAVLTSQGNLLRIDADAFEKGSATEMAKSSDIDESYLFNRQFVFEDGSAAWIGPSGFRYVLYSPSDANSVGLKSLQEPAHLPACDPVAIGNDLIVPSSSGLILRIDPKTGQYAGSPLSPQALAPGQTVTWNRPAKIGESRIVIGNGENRLMLLDVSSRDAIRQVSELEIDGTIRSSISSIGDSVLFVAETPKGFRLIKVDVSGERMAQAGDMEMAGMTTQDPILVGDTILVATDDENLTATGTALQKSWSIKTSGNRLASAVMAANGSIRLCFEKGTVQDIGPNGDIVRTVELGQPITHEPVIRGDQMIFTAVDGSLLIVDGAGS